MTAIEWTDETWNPTTGCDRVSPGCANCYALTLAARLKAMGQPRYQRDGDPKTSGPGFGVTLHPDKLDEPLHWRKPRRVFVNSMSDLFHEEIPFEFVDDVFAVMAAARQHTFQVLTKRPERAFDYFSPFRLPRRRILNIARQYGAGPTVKDWPLPNVWLGVSIENSRHTWRADVLREIPAAVRFISAEPLLGSLLWREGKRHDAIGEIRTMRRALDLTGIDWLIVGGESGPGARPMQPEWARELRDACLAENPQRDPNGLDNAGPAYFFKQWGGRTPKSGGRLLDGREWSEYPKDPNEEGSR